MATLRMLLMIRNARLLVPLLGFVEVMVWIVAVGSAILNLDSVWHLLAYAGGSAMGSLVGLAIEEKLALGLASIQIISRNGGVEVAQALRELGFGVTEFAGRGREG